MYYKLVLQIDSIDEELIIYIEDISDPNSSIILSYGKEDDNGIKLENNKKYYYLIEVFLAKEFITDLRQSFGYPSDKNELADRLFEYCINDA